MGNKTLISRFSNIGLQCIFVTTKLDDIFLRCLYEFDSSMAEQEMFATFLFSSPEVCSEVCP
jgi:hypothetical protein